MSCHARQPLELWRDRHPGALQLLCQSVRHHRETREFLPEAIVQFLGEPASLLSGRLTQRAFETLAFALGSCAPASTLLVLHRPKNGRTESGRPILEHVVACTGEEAFDGRLIPQGTCHHDHGNAWSSMTDHLQGTVSVEFRELGIGENQVGLKLIERLCEIFLGLHAPCHECEARPAQLALQDFRLLGYILQHQDLQFRMSAHWLSRWAGASGPARSSASIVCAGTAGLCRYP